MMSEGDGCPLWLTGNVQPLHFRQKGRALEAEPGGSPFRSSNPPVRLAQSAKDELPLAFFQSGDTRDSFSHRPGFSYALEFLQRGSKYVALRQNDRPLNEVLQFPNVSRPGI